jgi:hypothetical protein
MMKKYLIKHIQCLTDVTLKSYIEKLVFISGKDSMKILTVVTVSSEICNFGSDNTIGFHSQKTH